VAFSGLTSSDGMGSLPIGFSAGEVVAIPPPGLLD
jgi:hypothetical protein